MKPQLVDVPDIYEQIQEKIQHHTEKYGETPKVILLWEPYYTILNKYLQENYPQHLDKTNSITHIYGVSLYQTRKEFTLGVY